MELMVGGSTGGGGDCIGDRLNRNCCLRAKAAIAGSVEFLAHTAFAVRAAITAVAAWWWWEWRLMRGSKTLLTARNGLMGGTIATRRRFMETAFYQRQLERPAPSRPLTTAMPTARSRGALFTLELLHHNGMQNNMRGK